MAQKKKPVKEAPKKQAFDTLQRIAVKLSNEVFRPLLPQLSISQFGILQAIHHNGPMLQKELARHIQKTTGNITTVIDNLEKKGLVKREIGKKDRRCFRISLTPDGSRLIMKLLPAHTKHVENIMGKLTKMEQEKLMRICKKFEIQDFV